MPTIISAKKFGSEPAVIPHNLPIEPDFLFDPASMNYNDGETITKLSNQAEGETVLPLHTSAASDFPVFRSSGINQTPAIEFHGSDSYSFFYANNDAATANNDPATYGNVGSEMMLSSAGNTSFTVAMKSWNKSDDNNDYIVTLWSPNRTTLRRWQYQLYHKSTNSYYPQGLFMFGSGAYAAYAWDGQIVEWPTGEIRVITCRVDASGNGILRYNGNQVGSATSAAPTDLPLDRFYLGGNSSTANLKFPGMLGNFIWYNRAFSDQEVDTMEQRLMDKFNI